MQSFVNIDKTDIFFLQNWLNRTECHEWHPQVSVSVCSNWNSGEEPNGLETGKQFISYNSTVMDLPGVSTINSNPLTTEIA